MRLRESQWCGTTVILTLALVSLRFSGASGPPHLDPDPSGSYEMPGCVSDGCDGSIGLVCNGYECVGKPGSRCRFGGQLNVTMTKCMTRTYCSSESGLCECVEGYIPSTGLDLLDDVECFLTQGQTCGPLEWPCSRFAGLECLAAVQRRPDVYSSPGMTCDCPEGSEWSQKLRMCQLRENPVTVTQLPSIITHIHGNDDEDDRHRRLVLVLPTGVSCPSNSFPSPGGGCRCYGGYSPTLNPGGPCRLQFGARCDDNVEELRCNSDEDLTCTEGRCRCGVWGSEFDLKERKCVSSGGGRRGSGFMFGGVFIMVSLSVKFLLSS